MPVLEVHTTYAASFFPKDFVFRLADASASIFKRRRKGMVTLLNTDRQLFTGENCTDPVFLLRVFNADAFKDEDENRTIMKKMFEFLTSEIGVPDESIRVLLHNVPSINVGMPGDMPGGVLVADFLKALKKDEGQ